MKNFDEDIKTAIIKLKQLHKKNLISAKKTALLNLDDFNIKQKELRNQNALTLYHKARVILNAINEHLSETPVKNRERGLEEYSIYLQDLINQYYQYENHILHKDRFAASILLDAIQLCHLPPQELNEAIAADLKEKTEILCEIGTNNTINQLLRAFKQQTAQQEFFFLMQINHLRKTLRQKGRRLKKPSKIQQH